MDNGFSSEDPLFLWKEEDYLSEAENRMGVMPIQRLIVSMSWPMMLSMLIQALYNMVDSYFVSQISYEAFVALSYAYPAQTMMIAICVGTGVGVNSMLARRLGEKRAGEANAVAMNGYFVYLLSWVVFLIFALTMSRPFIGFFTNDAVVLGYGTQYTAIVIGASLGVCMQFAAERILQATGNAMGPMVVQGIGAVINLILDPIFIFGYFGVPAMGVAGAAIATVLGQFVGMGVGFWMVARNKVLPLQLRGFRPSGATIRDIYRIGAPAIVMQSLGTVMTLGLNKIAGLPRMVAAFQDAPVFILGAYFKLQSFVFMPVFGINNGITPILGYNYGARNRKRITDGIHFSLGFALAIMAVGTVLFLAIPGPLMSIFSPTEAALALGVSALRVISVSFLFAGVSIILSAAFQALGAPKYSLIISLLRQLVIVLPAALLLVYVNPALVWWCLPIAEVLSCGVALLLYKRVHRQHIMPLELSGPDSLCKGV